MPLNRARVERIIKWIGAMTTFYDVPNPLNGKNNINIR